ncbi:MAG: hypothetical protein WCC53_15600 [Thermoanaerobaculia bacterium]
MKIRSPLNAIVLGLLERSALMRRAVVLVALAVLFSCSLEAQTKTTSRAPASKRAPDAKYEAALDALQELDSAASVGLKFSQFNERVINVKIKVDKLGVFTPNLDPVMLSERA